MDGVLVWTSCHTCPTIYTLASIRRRVGVGAVSHVEDISWGEINVTRLCEYGSIDIDDLRLMFVLMWFPDPTNIRFSFRFSLTCDFSIWFSPIPRSQFGLNFALFPPPFPLPRSLLPD